MTLSDNEYIRLQEVINRNMKEDLPKSESTMWVVNEDDGKHDRITIVGFDLDRDYDMGTIHLLLRQERQTDAALRQTPKLYTGRVLLDERHNITLYRNAYHRSH